MGDIGKYQIIRKLATGGMAEVFLARAAGPMGFEKTLVVKRILPHLAEDPVFVQMFLGEAKLAAQLNHPNVVQIFDFGEADGQYFLAMEYIDGLNLRALVKRARTVGRPIPFALAAKTIAFAAEGLAYAHDFADPNTGEPLELIHRDISPDNILLGRNGGVKVVDFGIARAANQTHHTRTGTLKGKLSYMPPEQLQAQPLDRRVDVFALGVVLYELLTGLRPFEAVSEVAVMQAILYEPFIPAVTRRPDLPPALQAVLDRALAKERDQRYPSCRELQQDLERFIHSQGETISAYQLAQLVSGLSSPAETPPQRTPSQPASKPQLQVLEPEPVPPSAVDIDLRTELAPPPLPDASPTPGAATAVTSFAAPPAASPAQRAPSRLPLVAGALALLGVMGAGIAWLRMEPEPAPPQPTREAQAPTPVAAPAPEPTPAPVAAAPAVVVAEPQSPKEVVVRSPRPRPAKAPEVIAAREAPSVESPRQTAPAAAQLARFRVESSPAGQVRVNGRFVGASPVNVQGITPGEVVVEVYDSRVGFRKTQTFNAVAGDNGTRRVVAQPGTLEFRVRPFASVFLDERPLGQTPFDAVNVYEGKHTIRLINSELKKDVTVTFEVKPGANVFKYNLSE